RSTLFPYTTLFRSHRMPLAHQRAHRLVGEAGFEVDLATVAHRGGLARGFGGTVVLDAWRIAGFLQVHAEVDQVHQDLRMALRLHRTAHHAEAQPRLAVVGDERGNDGVERTLARCEGIRMAFLQHELF